MKKKGILYVVSTPIGNLEDITLRAIRVLKEVELIAAEDTRRTRKLLSAYSIPSSLTSLHDHNEPRKSSFIIAKLLDGIDVAYVSDAGTPGISDPGYLLINQAIAHDIQVVPVPGPSAVIAALSASGLPMDSFVFLGFLPSRTGRRTRLLQSMKEEPKTMVFYESPRRVVSTLREIKEHLGERKIVMARELTKVYEELLRGTTSELITALEPRQIKGEITFIVSGSAKVTEMDPHDTIVKRVRVLQENPDLSTRDMVDIISQETGISRKAVYDTVLLLLEKGNNR